MNVIRSWVEENGRLHFTLIDPDKQTPSDAGKLASLVESYGSDAIMVGGSTAGGLIVDETVKAIKEKSSLPTILFPGSSEGFSRHADYIFFMSLLNSRNRRFLVEEQAKAAPFLKKSGVKPIPMAYVVVSTSSKPTTVEKLSDLDKITPGDVGKAVAYALVGQYFGMDCVYLEAGSGAEWPVSCEMVSAVKKEVDVPLIVGGGIRSSESAASIVDAGADVVVTGTIVERDPMLQKRIIEAVKK